MSKRHVSDIFAPWHYTYQALLSQYLHADIVKLRWLEIVVYNTYVTFVMHT